MNRQKKAAPLVGKYLYGIGGLHAVTEVIFLLLFLPSFRMAGINEFALMIGAAVGIALPSAIMPLVYGFINGSTLISTGRYHIPLVGAGLLSALAFVLTLGVGNTHPASQGFALFGLTFCYSLCVQIFSYSYFSIGRRLDSSGGALRVKNAFEAVAVVLGALIVLWITYDSRDSVRAIFGCGAIIAVIACLTVYMSTVQSMPSFIRVEPHHKRSVKEHYRRFFAPLKVKKVRFFALAVFFDCTSFFLAAAALPLCVFAPSLGFLRGYKLAVIIISALVPVVAVTLLNVLRKDGGKKNSSVSLGFAVAQFACAAAVAVFLCLPVGKVVTSVALYSFAALTGFSLGASISGESAAKDFVTAMPITSPGKYFCLRNLVAALGFALGAALSCVLNVLLGAVGGTVTAVVACSAYAAFALVGAVLLTLGYSPDKEPCEADEAETVGEASAEINAPSEDK